MRITLKELILIFTCQLLFNQLFSSFLLFLFNYIGKKRFFNKAFNINNQLSAKNYTRKEMNLSFTAYQYAPAIKANKAW